MSVHSAPHAECRMEYGGMDRHPTPVGSLAHGELAVAAVLDDAHAAIASRMACRQLRFHVVDKAGAARITGSRSALARALVGLLENAIAACLQGDYVELSAIADEQTVRIAVRDTGCGIRQEVMARLFEIDAGCGNQAIGLPLVRSVAEAHGGRVAARSAPGRGSEFALYLPRAA